jgi:RND family efflux transporter MFP subunit
VVSRILVLFLVLSTLAGCSGRAALPPAPEVSRSVAVEVDVASVRLADLPRWLSTVGTSRSMNEASISPRSAGVVVDVPVDLGDLVREGDVLIQQDPEEMRLQIEQDRASLRADLAALGIDQLDAPSRPDEDAPAVQKARANLDNARQSWDRNQNLYRANLIAEQELQTSKQALLSAQADYQGALDQVRTSWANVGVRRSALRINQQRLANLTTRAPFDGYITAKNVNRGDYASPGGSGQEPYIRLTQLDPIDVRLEIAQVYAEKLKIGQQVEVTADAFPGRTFKGRVVHVNPASSAQSRTIAVDARFANPHGLLRPGLFGAVQLRLGTRLQAPLVPEAALQKTIGAFQVFVVERHEGATTVRAVPVSTGERVGTWMEVEGLKGGQQVAVNSLDRLFDGAHVTVRTVVHDPGAPGR